MAQEVLQKVLFTDDDPDIQMIVTMALEEIEKLTVCCCSSGKETLDVAEKFMPDLIVLDVMMPGMDGLMTYKELMKNSQLQGVPVIFLTALSGEKEIAEYKKAGICDVIIKPFDPMTLGQRLKETWKRVQELKNLENKI